MKTFPIWCNVNTESVFFAITNIKKKKNSLRSVAKSKKICIIPSAMNLLFLSVIHFLGFR